MPEFIEILPEFSTNLNFWGCTYTPAPPPPTPLAGRSRGRKPPSGRFLCSGQLRSKALETGAAHGRPVLAALDQGVFANTAGSTEVARGAEESCR